MNCSSLTELDLNKWDMSECQSLLGMFYNCVALKTLNIDKWNVENVKSMSGTFCNCYNLEKININSWNTKSLVQINSILSGCSNLKEINLNNWNTTNCTTIAGAFSSCEKLLELNISNWKTKQITDVNYYKGIAMNCPALCVITIKKCDNINLINDIITYCPDRSRSSWAVLNIMNTPILSGINFYMAENKRWKIYYRDKDRSIPNKIKD